MLRQATVLFADLRGFSAIASAYPAESVFELVKRWYAAMSALAHEHQGCLANFMGDAIMMVFARDDPAEDARRAVRCAVEMQIALDTLNRTERGRALPELYMGIGINSGEVIFGALGADAAPQAVIGDQVNLAARIEAFCLRGQILLAESTHALCGGGVDTGGPVEVHVKGRAESVKLREVHGIASTGKTVPRQERRRSPRVQLRFPFSYQVLASDVVSPVRLRGTVLDLGYGGLSAQLKREHGLFEELKLELALPLIGYRANDVYGRIVNSEKKERRRRYGIEFTSLGAESSRMIQSLVHLLIQGTANDPRFPLPR